MIFAKAKITWGYLALSFLWEIQPGSFYTLTALEVRSSLGSGIWDLESQASRTSIPQGRTIPLECLWVPSVPCSQNSRH